MTDAWLVLISYIHQKMTIDNIVMWETRLSITGLFQDSDFAETLKIQNQPEEESHVFSEVENLFP